MGDEQEFVRDGDDPAERLLALTLVLLTSPYGLTKADIFSSIRGYQLAISDGVSTDALEKKFERDKDTLRNSGIVLDIDKSDSVNHRYSIKRDGFVWPKGTSLSPTQLTLLNLASQVWAQASLSGQARQALTKLKALGASGDAADLIGYAPRIRTHEPSFMPLSAAVNAGYVVSFDYRKPGGKEPKKRTFSPWQLINISGQWLARGWDHDSEETRHFMLKRITSRVNSLEKVETIVYRVPSDKDIADADASLEQHTGNQLAILEVTEGSEAWFRYEMDVPGTADPAGRLSMNFMDLHLLAEDLRDYGSSVRVISPKELADAVRTGFEKVVDDHA